MIRVLLCRHPETYHNLLVYGEKGTDKENYDLDKMPRPILFTERDTMLTINGERQASDLARKLKEQLEQPDNFDNVSIISSSWYRAERTKEILMQHGLLKPYNIMDIGTSDLLTDVDLGNCDPIIVQNNEYMEPIYADYWERRIKNRALARPEEDMGESINDVRLRVRSWFEKLSTFEDNQTIVVISHAGFIYALISELLNLSPEQMNYMMDKFDFKNGDVMKIDMHEGEFVIEDRFRELLSNCFESMEETNLH